MSRILEVSAARSIRTRESRQQVRMAALMLSARSTLALLRSTVVQGSDHPCWSPREMTASRKEGS